jgi:hypothetical protein
MTKRLRRLLRTHAPADSDLSRVSIEERIEQNVLHHLFRAAAEAAWRRLEELMASSGLAWLARGGASGVLETEELLMEHMRMGMMKGMMECPMMKEMGPGEAPEKQEEHT